MKTKFILGVLALTMFAVSSCKKPKDGETGPKGADGNANVIASNPVTVSSWTASGTAWSANIPFSEVTSDVVNTGTVQVFIQYGSSWWALPDINGVNSTSFGFSTGLVKLLNVDSDGSATPNPGTQVFRIVVIPSRTMLEHPDVNFQDYEALKKVFHLKN